VVKCYGNCCCVVDELARTWCDTFFSGTVKHVTQPRAHDTDKTRRGTRHGQWLLFSMLQLGHEGSNLIAIPCGAA
jgi:hypothetical protein